MAVHIKAEYDASRFKEFLKLRNSFPDLRAQALGYIGAAGKRRLKNSLLSGQEITLRTEPTDKRGRRTIQYKIGRGAQHVSISSYPVNLFEKGRKLRSGKTEPGKYIITRKLKNLMASEIQGLVNEVDRKIFQTILDKT